MATIKDVRMGLWMGATEAMVNFDSGAVRKRLDVLQSSIQEEEKPWSELMAFEKKLDGTYRKRMDVIIRGERYRGMNPIVESATKNSDISALELWRSREAYNFWARLIIVHKLVSGAS